MAEEKKNYVTVEYKELSELMEAKANIDSIRLLIEKEEYVTDAIRAIRIILNMELKNLD